MNIPLGFGREYHGRKLLRMTVEELQGEIAKIEEMKRESCGCAYDMFGLVAWGITIQAIMKHKEKRCELKQSK